MMKAFFEGAAQVLPVSPALSQGILQIAPKAKMTVVPNIIDEIDFSKPKEFFYQSFCVVGDVVFSIKRQDIILKAFRQLPPPPSVNCTFMEEDQILKSYKR